MHAKIKKTDALSLMFRTFNLLLFVLAAFVFNGSRASADTLSWDANGATAGQTDGAGAWLGADQWFNGTGNTGWISGSDATFGASGVGGSVTLASPTSVGLITFDAFSGEYSVGSTGQILTITGGINKTAPSGDVNLNSPIILGTAQTWTVDSNELSLGVRNAGRDLDTNGHQLTVDGTGSTFLKWGVISGSGGITKNGSGYMEIGGQYGDLNHTYTGATIINGGVMRFTGKTGGGNWTLNDGVLDYYYRGSMFRTLGAGSGQVQILGGMSGFTAGLEGKIRFNGNSNYEVVWGSTFFNPSEFVVGIATNSGAVVLENKYDLNGATRTVRTATPGSRNARFQNVIRNSSPTPAGLIKVGVGAISLNAANTYDGGTTLEDGTVLLGNVSALGSSTGPLTVNGGLLDLNNIEGVTVGNLTGTGGTIANNGNASILLTIGSGGGTGGDYQGVIADHTNAGSGLLALAKIGTGTTTLSGNNTYTGTTTISGGTLQIGAGGSTGSLATSEVINEAALVYDLSDDFSIGYQISGIGGLTKQGAGTMTFPNPNIYSGQITITEGELKFDQPNTANQAGSMTIIETGATLRLNFSGTQTLGDLYIGATKMPTGIYKAIGSSATGTELAQITGTGTLSVTGDIYPPTIVSIQNDISTYAVASGSPVTYTITFSEDIEGSSVSASDFANAGTALISVGTITEISPRIFTVQITPTSAGTLQLTIPVGANLTDSSGNVMDTTSEIVDETSVATYLLNEGLPQFVAASPIATNVGSTITMSMPAGAQPGDLLIANIVNYSSGPSSSVSSSISTAETDWSSVRTGYFKNQYNVRVGVYSREVLASDGLTFTLDLGGVAPYTATGVIMAFSNVDLIGGPLDGSASSVKSETDPQAIATASHIYTVTPDALIVTLGMALGDNSVTFSNWANPTMGALDEIYDVSSNSGSKAISMGAAIGLKKQNSLVNAGTADLSSISHYAAMQFALKSTTNDSLFDALKALKAHVTGEATLTSGQIAGHKATIVSNRRSFRFSMNSIAAAIDLVHTYDELLGPLWIAHQLPNRAQLQDDIHYTVFKVMQYIVNYSYSTANLSSNYDLFNHFAFGSSANFPGSCPAPADPNQTHTALINADYPNTFGRDVFGQNEDPPKPTGTYLAPGSIATVTVPASLVGRGYTIRVGAHNWDFSEKPSIKRLDLCAISYPINSVTTQVANPLGGGIYIEVPDYIDGVGVVSVEIKNAVRSPYFSAKSFHQTTLDEWQNTERHHTAPWADFQSEKVMMQVPTSWIYALEDPVTLMADWDRTADATNDLMGFPRDRGKETIYNQVDVLLRAVAFTPGYPAVNNTYNPNATYDGYANNYLVRGPKTAPPREFHELGHGYKFEKFEGERESDVNLLHVAVFQGEFGYSFDKAFHTSLPRTTSFNTIDNTAVAWMMCDNFLEGNIMEEHEKQYALKGHAKYVETARIFGWKRLSNYFASFNEDYENNQPIANDDDSLLLRLSREARTDIRPLFHFWGVPPTNAASLENAIQAASLPASAAIYDTLIRYKSLVPPDNATFRTFAFNWRERQPLATGFSEEREHARRWDSYDGAEAIATASRAQQIIDLYFPAGRPPHYGDWRTQWAEVDLLNPQSDLDSDGMSNDLERIWGLDPTNAMSRNPVHFNFDLKSGHFSYTRSNPALSELNYTVWTSTDLDQWTEDTGALQTPSAPDSHGSQTVETVLSPELLAHPALFIRVQADE